MRNADRGSRIEDRESIEFLLDNRSSILDHRSSILDLQSPISNPQSVIRNPQSTELRMKLVGANRAPKVVGLEELPGKSNYFAGRDPNRWRAGIPTYAKVKYEGVYPGV